jgi:hypothetical protein
MSRFARALALGAMLSMLLMAGMTAVAQAQSSNASASTRHRALGRVEFQATGDQPAPSPQETAADATVRRLLARERFSIPTAGPAQAPSPVRPAEHSGWPAWLAPALAVLALVLALGAGVAVLVVRRADRVERAGQTA